jgi:hypothetical protein
MSTANDLITGALRRINSYSPGETLAAQDTQDALDTLNDLLDSYSTDELLIYGSEENVLTFTPGQYKYTIGSALGGTFQGTVTSGSAVITGVTVPSSMVVNGFLTDSFGVIPTNAYITAIGANTVTMSAPATGTPGAPEVITYQIPGDFARDVLDGSPVVRPLRITAAFTRLTTTQSSLDYPIEIISQERYTEIGFKGIPAPWPIALWYNPTVPVGTLYFYQNPSQAGQLHLFTDTILTNLASVNTTFTLPQGYSRFLKWALAKELAPEYEVDWSRKHEDAYKEARSMVMSLNAEPAVVARYDDTLIFRNGTDAGWYLTGGFR